MGVGMEKRAFNSFGVKVGVDAVGVGVVVGVGLGVKVGVDV